MKNKFIPLSGEEIVAVRLSNQKPVNLTARFQGITLTLAQLILTMIESLSLPQETKEKLFNHGLECHILKFTSEGWQRGKIRVKLTLEFAPEDAENS